jgi:O-acetyl-ADP-ribose deacetylase (regulator of RNase III)/uncharacterized protein YwgA
MIRFLVGDLFQTKVETLVNTVNCVGIMGKGVAETFKNRYPAMYEDYRHRCDANEVRLGEPYIYKDLAGASIMNFPTKDHWKSASRMTDIEAGLDYFAKHAKQWGIRSVAFPPLGCGNGGLEWSDVGPLIYRKLGGLDIEIEVYAPFGTPKQQLTKEFLAQDSLIPSAERGRQRGRIQPGWVAMLEVVRRLQEQSYARPVGRTIFQKIGYILTDQGIPTGLEYGKGSFGPFAAEMSELLTVLANKNWWVEESLGSMKRIRVSEKFAKEVSTFRKELEAYEPQISKTVDLFSRIGSTAQAEEVSTVLFASRQLAEKAGAAMTEGQILDYILQWKPQWDNVQGKIAIREGIMSLNMLGWIDATPDMHSDS